MRSLDFVEKSNLRRDLPPFRVGDTVRVHVNVIEGDKERIQVFEGVVIRRRGASAGETFTVRKISNGVGVERIFPVQSPAVTKIEIKSRGFVRRSKLYYLRALSGRKARLHSKVRDLSGLVSDEEREGPLEEEVLPAEPDEAEASDEAAEETVAEEGEESASVEEPTAEAASEEAAAEEEEKK